MAGKGIEFHEHPHFRRMKDKWQTWQDLYEGDQATLIQDKYLIRHMMEGHPIEGPMLRRLREQRSWYLNLTEPVVSVDAGLFFKNDPTVDQSVKELFGEAYEDVDGEGNNFLAFLKGPVMTQYLLCGKVAVYTEGLALPKPREQMTRADEVGLRAFFTLVPALAAKDWKENPGKAGDYVLFRFEYTEVKDRTDLTEKPKEVLRTKVLRLNGNQFTITVYEKAESQGGQNSSWVQVGDVLSVPQPSLPVAELCGESWVKDVAPQQLALFNLMSAWYNQLNHQAFQRIVFAGPGFDDATKKAWSEFTALSVPQGTETTVIQPAPMEALESAIERTIDRLFKVAFNRTQALAANTKAVASDDTLRELKDDLYTLILNEIDRLETFANQLVQDYAAYLGRKDFKGKVTLSREITSEDIEQQLELLAMLRTDIDKVLPWKKATLKKFLEKQNLSEEDTETIRKEIDALKKEDFAPPLLLGNGLSAMKQNGGQREPTTNAEGSGETGGPPGQADGIAGRTARQPPAAVR